MPQNVDEIAAALQDLVQPGFRDKLIARGLARGLIWQNGVLPPESPPFSFDLTTDLLDHGFRVLTLALKLRELGGEQAVVDVGLLTAAEAIESAVRRGKDSDIERGFHLTIAAAAFHIGGYAARSFSLFETDLSSLNLASHEKSLVLLMRRDFPALRNLNGGWLQAVENSDAGIVGRLKLEEDFSVDDVVALALTRLFHKACAYFEAALLSGQETFIAFARTLIDQGVVEAGEANHVPLWWSFTIARHLFDDLWGNSLHQRLPENGGPTDWPKLRSNFLELLASRPIAEVDLWPSQLEAATRVMDTSDDLVVALPTSAGKTRIAELCILRSLADGKRVVYVTPLRALSAQVEIGLARTFRPLGYSVTAVYGASGVASADIETLASAAIVVATPEKLDFAIRQEPEIIDDVGLIVLDEGHMIGLSERDIRYEMLLQRLLRRQDAPGRRLVCLSAVFSKGDAFEDFTAWLRSDSPGTAIQSTWRPTRQRPAIIEWLTDTARFELAVEGEKPFVPRFVEAIDPIPPRKTRSFPADTQELIVASTSAFLDRGQSVLIYCPQKISVEATAKAFLKSHKGQYFVGALAEQATSQIANALRVGKEWLGKDHPAVASLHLGIAVHHGSLPRAFLGEVESLLKRRLLPVCICSPTLAQGVDLNFSVLLFRSLIRNRKPIPPKEFANVVGRVGRAFVDLDGIYALPIFESDRSKVRSAKNAFTSLIDAAKKRQLESGVRMLLDVIIHILSQRLLIFGPQLIEYVTNMQSTWEVKGIDDEDNAPGVLQACLNELDTAILGIVDVLDLPVGQLASYLDQCLKSSYWQRQLARSDTDLKKLQETIVRSRAKWVWSRTDTAKRKGYFAAGVGYAAGKALDENRTALSKLLTTAEEAIKNKSIEDAIVAIVGIAKILFTIHPFVLEDSVEDWPDVLGNWIRGQALSEFADNDGVAFIQGDVVFRLVWGVEAARLHIKHVESLDDEADQTDLAMCLTYGVPNRTAALFLEAGMTSRTLACNLAETIKKKITNSGQLKSWVTDIIRDASKSPQLKSSGHLAEWKRFLERFDHREHSHWKRLNFTLPVTWNGRPSKPGSRVRIMVNEDEERATVHGLSWKALGETTIPNVLSDHFFGIVSADQKSLAVTIFGKVRPSR